MRYAILGAVLAAAGAAAAAAWAALASRPATPGSPTAALVVVYEGGKVSKAHRIADAGQLAALAAHFPGFEKRPSSGAAAGWKKGYDVYFDFPDGASVRLAVSSPRNRPTHWSAGRGDFEAEGDFHNFVAELGK